MNEIISKNRTAIMGFAMMSIMLFHQPFFYGNPFVDFFHLYGFWGVEVFLFVSGFGIVHSLKKNSLAIYYTNRLKRLLPSCLLVGIGKYVLVQMGFVEFSNAHVVLLLTNLYLWYIYAILAFYLIAPLLYKGICEYGILLFIGVCLFSYGCTIIPFGDSQFYLINHLGWITSRLPVFMMGMMYAASPINISVKKTVIIGAVFFVVCMILQLGSIMVKYQWKVPYLNLLLLFATPMLCVLGSYMNKWATKIKLSRVVSFFGTFSLELYLWHEYIFWNAVRDERFSAIHPSILFVLALTLSFLLAYLTQLLAKWIQNRMWNRVP